MQTSRNRTDTSTSSPFRSRALLEHALGQARVDERAERLAQLLALAHRLDHLVERLGQLAGLVGRGDRARARSSSFSATRRVARISSRSGPRIDPASSSVSAQRRGEREADRERDVVAQLAQARLAVRRQAGDGQPRARRCYSGMQANSLKRSGMPPLLAGDLLGQAARRRLDRRAAAAARGSGSARRSRRAARCMRRPAAPGTPSPGPVDLVGDVRAIAGTTVKIEAMTWPLRRWMRGSVSSARQASSWSLSPRRRASGARASGAATTQERDQRSRAASGPARPRRCGRTAGPTGRPTARAARCWRTR